MPSHKKAATSAKAQPRDNARGWRRAGRRKLVNQTQTWFADFDFDLDGFMGSVVERIPRITRAEGCVVELVDGQDMVYRAASPHLASHLNMRLSRAGSFSGLCVEQARHVDIQHHRVGFDLRQSAQALMAATRDEGVIAGQIQTQRDQVEDAGVVVNHRDPLRRGLRQRCHSAPRPS